MSHNDDQQPWKRRNPLWTVIFLSCIVAFAVLTPLVEAQPPPSPPLPSSGASPRATNTVSTSTRTAAPLPSQIPIPPPDPPTPIVNLPPGTRELQDGQVVADRVGQGQLQTYHLSVVQQHLPVRRQLERIIFHPGPKELYKRQVTYSPTSSAGSGSLIPTSTTFGVGGPIPAPTRTIAPTLPSPFANGTYAVYISVSTCSTPKSGANLCPPLMMYISVSASQPLPGPGQDPKVVQVVTSQEGLIQFTAYTNKDIFFSLQAPALQGAWTGDWAVEVGASSQGYVQGYQSSQGLVLDDSDSTNASFLTHNFTAVPTFKVYLVNSTSLPVGLTHSLCAIEVIQPMPLTKANMVVTQTNRTSNLDGSQGRLILPPEPTFEQFGQRRQVLVQGLRPGTEYTAFFITDVLNQAGAEVMYAMTPFRTKRRDNCVLITDLQLCREVAYAVPVTPLSTLPGSSSGTTVQQDVKHYYDDFTSRLMETFTKVLKQYDCSKSQYSFIRNCTDCERAYRRWLCGVSIPRCTDVEDITDSNNYGYVRPEDIDPHAAENPYLLDRSNGPVVVGRNTSTSRGAVAQLSAENNTLMNPGEYGEVLPCVDLCYDVVQSCPSFLGFNCPVKNMGGNYARMNAGGFQCNGLGIVSIPSGARASRLSMLKKQGIVAIMVIVSILVS
ncbi:stretch-activated cation channel mid1 [Lobosporangium transversale]|uniref:Stretch-activated Ca2+-permeable channel component-domain-containing protein n=1 Tax=Lobosporangium transversale TaxID=64571 RepID=A0A1Y2GP89_9FUNG|nr:stretch-activated Ca2+-permeable channel component-domain-containing protein [Lobosporangium transversale]KAF9914909.1 stretch-activated cation channel mid1 [Lobosporangium transversale]ORZ17426.1 stretch-activated Ca2+-permeable channel component-domain-containing protein [Lobosporangium transversale]|eukprot:XP_021881813.1 stretch-activated Ca2+-permeable channel component-domain-containing protein [Lobosporangium transversale]